MQHVEVIIFSGILAVTVFAVVTTVVSATVYFATRPRVAHQPVAVPRLAPTTTANTNVAGQPTLAAG